jgi:hypothetical protein
MIKLHLANFRLGVWYFVNQKTFFIIEKKRKSCIFTIVLLNATQGAA